MKRAETTWWVFYIADDAAFDPDKVGKWMYFFIGEEGAAFADRVCKEAVEKGIVKEAKYANPASFGLNPNATNPDGGVACFYLHSDDMEGHKKVINFFFENNMIPRTKSGRYKNIAYKLDRQTRANEYGDAFTAKLNLDKFVDLTTGEWIAE